MSAASAAALMAGAIVVALGHRFRPRPLRCHPPPAPPMRLPRSRRSRWQRDRRAERADPGDVADWCDRLARAVRGGNTLTGAIRSVTPPPTAASPVAQIVLALDRGTPLERAAASVPALTDLAVALTVIRACASTGGPAAEPLDRAAAALRARAAESAERRTQSEQSRLSAVVMTVLPIAMLLVLVATSPSVRYVVLSPPGLLLVGAGSLLNLGGWTWMRRIIDGAAR